MSDSVPNNPAMPEFSRADIKIEPITLNASIEDCISFLGNSENNILWQDERVNSLKGKTYVNRTSPNSATIAVQGQVNEAKTLFEYNMFYILEVLDGNTIVTTSIQFNNPSDFNATKRLAAGKLKDYVLNSLNNLQMKVQNKEIVINKKEES